MHAALSITGNYLQRMEQVRGVQIALWIARQDVGMSIEEAAIFLNTSFIVLCGELQGGVQCQCIYMYLSGHLFVSVRESDLPLAAEHWLCTKWEQEFSNNSEPLLRATQRCVECLSPPVTTLKTAGRARKTRLPVKTLVSL